MWRCVCWVSISWWENSQRRLTWIYGNSQTVDGDLGGMDRPRPSASGWQLCSLVFMELLAVEPGPVPDAWTGSLEPIPYGGMPCSFLMGSGGRETELSPASTWYAMLCWFPWMTLPHLNGDRGWLDWVGDRRDVCGGNGRRRGRGNWLVCEINKTEMNL